jgi:hypothetical protein
MNLAVIPKSRAGGKQLFTRGCENLAALFSLDSNDRQRKAQPQFLLQINLHMVQAELLELDAAEIVNVGGVTFHFFEFELDLGLG